MSKNKEAKVSNNDAHRRTAEVSWGRQLLAIKDTLIIVLTPIVLLSIFFASTTRATRCAYSVLIVAVYWMTECLPISVTALLPVVLMTWLGVMDSKEICKSYLKDANFLFLGGLIIAVAVERWNLHKRVALRVLMLVGSKPVWILFGFMTVTGFLSMWLPNIPTTAMMIPIAAAVLKELDAHRKNVREAQRQAVGDNGTQLELEMEKTDEVAVAIQENHAGASEEMPLKEEADLQQQYDEEDKEFREFSCALKLCVAYASNVGGLATIIGSGPNIVFKGQMEAIYGPDTGLNFFSFLMLAMPLTIVLLPLTWITLVIMFIGPRKAFCNKAPEKKADMSANAVIKAEYAKLGAMTWPEAWITTLFLILAVLWITKNPQFVPGWGNAMAHNYVTDSSTAMTIAILFFLIPTRPPNYLCFRKKSDKTPPGPAPAILDWPTIHKNMQWGVIILLGGGFAIADACKKSDLSSAIAVFLSSLKVLPPFAIVLIISVLSVAITTFTANVACATLLIPIAAELANGVEIHPLYIMFPVTLATSFSYLLPVSTPSNAIVMAYGDITTASMLKVGIVNTITHLIVMQFAINTYGYALFNFGEFPEWARTKKAMALNATFADSFNILYYYFRFMLVIAEFVAFFIKVRTSDQTDQSVAQW